LARNTLRSGAGEASNLLLFGLAFVMARALGAADFGTFSAALAFVGLFRILPDLGMAYASTLQIARDLDRAEQLAGNLLGLQAVLSVITLALCLGLGVLRYDNPAFALVALLCLDTLFKAAKGTLRWLLKAFEHFGVEALSLVGERLALVAGVLVALSTGGGLIAIGLAFALVRGLDAFVLGVYVRARLVPLRPRCDLRLWWDLLRRGLPFAYAGAMVTLLFQVDQVLVEQWRGAEESGWYRAPALVLEGLTLVPRVLGYAIIPAMAVWHFTDKPAVTALFSRGSKYLLLVSLPIAAFGLLASEPFLQLLLPGYAKSVPAAQLLLPACVFMFLSNFAETTLACIDRWRAIVISSTLALLLNLVLNWFWIPRYGYVGAAWATLLAEGAYLVLAVWALGRAGHAAPWLRLSWRPLLCASLFGATLHFALPLGLIAASALASLVWLGGVLASGVLDRSELDALRSLWSGPPLPPVEGQC